MIRQCTAAEFESILSIINDAAQAYRGVIPDEHWHEPYMSEDQLRREMDAGVEFSCFEDSGKVVGVMGIQVVKDATLIRHAYVVSEVQGRGVGSELIRFLIPRAKEKLLVGTWASASWAIGFYERNGFRMVGQERKDDLLRTYWTISREQKDVSVVLEYEDV